MPKPHTPKHNSSSPSTNTHRNNLNRDLINKKLVEIETFLHLFNPWLLLVAIVLFTVSTLMMGGLVTILLLMVELVLLHIKQYRMWITTQLTLMVATIRNL